jgi:probable phosphoglycerate mutase
VDPPLTADGRADAELLGHYLTARPGNAPDVVYTSPMRRARETADAITVHGAVPLHVDDRLREFDHGAESYTPPELVTAEVQAALWQALVTGVWGTHRFDPDAFEHTVEAVFRDIIATHPSAVVAVVCHSGVINSFVGGVLERPRGMFFRPGYTSVTRVMASGRGRRELLTLNETHHLHRRSERSEDQQVEAVEDDRGSRAEAHHRDRHPRTGGKPAPPSSDHRRLAGGLTGRAELTRGEPDQRQRHQNDDENADAQRDHRDDGECTPVDRHAVLRSGRDVEGS